MTQTENKQYDEQNIFAKILRGEMPCVKVYEDEMTLAFMDVMPQADGHVLVIPKSPAPDILTLDAEPMQALILTAQKLARAVKKAMNCAGIRLMQLNGTEAGQTVFHIHIHIIPHYEGVALRPHSAAEMADSELLEAQAEKIRTALE